MPHVDQHPLVGPHRERTHAAHRALESAAGLGTFQRHRVQRLVLANGGDLHAADEKWPVAHAPES